MDISPSSDELGQLRRPLAAFRIRRLLLLRVVFALSALLFAIGATGCSSNYGWNFDFSDSPPPMLERRDIESKDQDVIVPGGKVTVAILPRDEEGDARKGLFTPGALSAWPEYVRSGIEARRHAREAPAAIARDPSADAPEKPRRRRAVQFILSADLDYSVALGADDGRGLANLEYIEFEGIQTLGPVDVEYEYDLHLGTLDVRTGVRFFDLVSLEGLTGLSINAMEFQLRTPTTRSTKTIYGYGGNIGARLTLTPHQVIDLLVQVQLHILGSPQNNQQSIRMTTLETSGQIHLTSNLSVFGGWRIWSYRDEINHGSDIEVKKLAGPTFGVLARF